MQLPLIPRIRRLHPYFATRVYLCPRGGGCGPGVLPLLEIEAGPDPSLVPQWWYDISFTFKTRPSPWID